MKVFEFLNLVFYVQDPYQS